MSVATIGLSAGYSRTHAADFVVDTPTIVQNGSAAHILDGNDSLTITSSGEIIVNGVDGVNASGDENRITNFGNIEVDGDTFIGINAQNDFNTVTNSRSGTITTTGEYGYGIYGRDGNSINNHGAIFTSGQNGGGIEVRDNNNILNTGSISTTNDQSSGIEANDNNTIINIGTISTAGIRSFGIDVQNNSTVVNEGTITTDGDNSEGISGSDFNTFINNGSIRSYSSGSAIYSSNDGSVINNGYLFSEGRGIVAIARHLVENHGSLIVNGSGRAIDTSDENTIINTGLIQLTGDGGEAIDSVDDNIITNSGSVLAFGTGTEAIAIRSNNIINNSGRVISAKSFSFDFRVSGAGLGANTLNLFAPSFIGGEIELGTGFGTDTAVNISTGASHSILWDFSTGDLLGDDPTIDGTVPWFYNSTTKQIATFDPSILTASVEALTDRTALVSATIQRRLEAAELVINGVQSGKPDGSGSETEAGNFDKSGAWVQVMASQSKNGGGAATLDRDIALGGLAVGYDANMGKATRFGVMAGYIDGSSEAASRWSKSFESDSSGFFAAGYRRKSFGQIFVDLGLSAGIGTDNETKRFVNDNLAALGESYSTDDPGTSFWISPEFAIGTQIKTMSNWTFSPSAKLRYAAEWFGGYTETGPSADANATVDDRMIAIGEARLELAASRHVTFGKTARALITARGGALGRASLGEDATITMLGVTQDISDFYEDSFAIFAGLDASFAIGDRLNLDLSTATTHGNDMTNVQGAAALGVLF
ncbi:autotransporter outer membrane beta-barrel domain-containing protein [Pararhizobium sp. IMCC21322]|uniref:autotransporter outer membrane beta-barrel domain-containing protein n=1 Tax=Pararhizobium sp. IMCC21322 TaxID=3067903 RepID=UPI002740F6D1|nr:autotransporter domain-containing protein [Pararhizobium sp. IMCC21322]